MFSIAIAASILGGAAFIALPFVFKSRALLTESKTKILRNGVPTNAIVKNTSTHVHGSRTNVSSREEADILFQLNGITYTGAITGEFTEGEMIVILVPPENPTEGLYIRRS